MHGCTLDANGVCKEHGPGTQGEADVINQMTDIVIDMLLDIGGIVATMGHAVEIARDRVTAENVRLERLGLPILNNVEATIEIEVRKVAEAIYDAQNALRAMRVAGPDAS
jgi:hypothetical protein